jgi:hypothetical protein
MSKRTNGWTEEKIARYYAEGRGKGDLVNYKPWLTIQNVPSSGRVHRFKGWKTNRVHHFLSDLERDYCFLLDWAEDVIDIREQFPLDREKTIQIAEDKQINHSVDSTTRTPIVMTTDFLITIRRGNEIKNLARTVKPSGELNDKRVIAKFETERQYWLDLGVDWGIVTEIDLPQEMCKNIGWVHSSFDLEASYDDLSILVYEYLINSSTSIVKTLNTIDKEYSYEQGTSLSIFKQLIAHKKILISMDKPLNLQIMASELTFRHQTTRKEGLAR